MQATIVMLMVLSGLGCHNKGCGGFQPPPTVTDGRGAAVSTGSIVSPGYPGYSAGLGSGSDCDASGYPGGALRSTLWSFILGRDPDVMTVREIEASVYSCQNGY